MTIDTDPTFAELFIRVQEEHPEKGYPVELILNTERNLCSGYLNAKLAQWVSTVSPFEDGKKLFQQLMCEDKLREGWATARAKEPLRIRLRIDSSAPELHTIIWETLQEDNDELAPPLAANAATPFSRYFSSRLPHCRPTLQSPIRMLVAIANPENLQDFNLECINVEEEMASLREAVGLKVELTELPQPCTLEALEAALQSSYHILHFIGHGAYDAKKKQAVLFLSNRKNQVRLVSDDEVSGMFRRHLVDTDMWRDDRLRLIFLASCKTAKRSPKDAFYGLAPRLMQAGIPAVLAMQDLIAAETAKRFARTFYQNLLEKGIVDLACNQARSAILSEALTGAAIPVLFMHLHNGQLFHTTPNRITPKVEPIFAGIPAKPEHLFGRESLMSEIRHRLITQENQLIALEGLLGVGKTALALALVYDSTIQQYFDGILWASLGPDADVMSVLTSWAVKLGLDVQKQETVTERAQAVQRAIGSRRMLLVIDDVWNTDQAKEVRCGGQNCAHLLTTRDRKIAYSFAGRNQTVNIPVLEDEAAYALLQRLALDAWEIDPSAAQKLIQIVGYLPLAVELLGGYLAAPEFIIFPDIVTEAIQTKLLNSQYRLQLAQQRLGQPEKIHQTLRETVLLSLVGLPEHVIQTFYALGAFASKPLRFNRDAALKVIGTDIPSLALLVTRNLVEIVDGQWLMLHQVISDVAREKTEPESFERHRKYYLALVNENREKWQQIESIYGQVKWAWQNNSKEEAVFDFIEALETYQSRQGLWDDQIEWIERGLQLVSEQHEPNTMGMLLHRLALVYYCRGEFSKAIDCHEQSIAFIRQVGNIQAEGMALGHLGMAHIQLGEERIAIYYFREALAIAREIEDRYHEGMWLGQLGYSYISHYPQAIRYYEDALVIAREIEDRYHEGMWLGQLGQVYADQRDEQQAISYFEEALTISREIGDRKSEGEWLGNFGQSYAALGEMDKALNYYEQALNIAREIGDRKGEGIRLYGKGSIYVDRGQLHKAIKYWQEALTILEELKLPQASTVSNELIKLGTTLTS